MKTVTIVVFVDVVAALSDDGLSDHLYLFDTNRVNGSVNEGTENLKTAVKKGDRVVWLTQSLEAEAYASVVEISIDTAFIEPERRAFAGTDIWYWIGQMKRDPADEGIPYSLKLKVGTRVEEMSASGAPCLVAGKKA